MPGLDPGIHEKLSPRLDVDPRVKPGGDEEGGKTNLLEIFENLNRKQTDGVAQRTVDMRYPASAFSLAEALAISTSASMGWARLRSLDSAGGHGPPVAQSRSSTV